MGALDHGLGKYRHEGCRCDVCCQAKREYNQAYYRRNREKIKAQNRAYRQANLERARAWERAYNETHREERNRKSLERYYANPEYRKAYNEANRERIRAYNRAYREANREKVREWNREWYKTHPEWVRAKVGKRRAQTSTGEMELKEITAHLEKILGTPCVYCGEPGEHIDHVVALARGGEHSARNLVSACAPCNLSKKDRPLSDFLNTHPAWSAA